MSDIHQQFFKLYLMQMDGSPLTESQLATLQTHPSNCPSCRADQRIYQRLQAQAGQRWAVNGGSIAVEQILRGTQKHKRQRWLSQPVSTLIWTGFIILVLVFVLFFISTSRPLPAVQPVASPTPRVTPTPQVFDAPASEISTYTLFSHTGCHFGGAVDMDENRVVVGAPCWGSPPGEGEGAGFVYVMRRSPGGIEAILTASDRDDGFQNAQNFGMSVKLINGTMIAVGAPGYDDPQIGDNIGAIYLFEFNGTTWVETGRLISSQPKPGAKIGTILSFDGNLLAASGSPEAGMVVSFERTGAGGWRELAQVPVPSPSQGKPYTVHIDLYGNTLAISTVEMVTPQDNLDQQAYLHSLKTSGIVTLYERVGDEWQPTYQTAPQEASLYQMDESAFGIPVSLGGEAGRATWLAVGKPGFAGSGREAGSVAIFERGDHGWKPLAELSLAPGEPVPGALPFFGHDPGPIFFGVFVEIEGNRLAVVSTFANTAYIFERQGQVWVYLYRLIPLKANGDPDDFQRRTVTMNGDSLLMGSPGELAGGEVYLFNLLP